MSGDARIRTALLLAAGMGSRLGHSPDAPPKCLLEVAGVSMLVRLVNALRAQGIKRLVIVVGYRQALVREAAAKCARGMHIEFVVNEQYGASNNIVSLWLARNAITEPFLLLESDLVFAPGLLDGMMTPDRMAVSHLEPWMNGTRVMLRQDNVVQSFLFPPFTGEEGQYKTVNIYSLSRQTWARARDCLERYVSRGEIGLYYEYCFAELLALGRIHFEACRFPADQWYEVDTASDCVEANRMFARSPAR